MTRLAWDYPEYDDAAAHWQTHQQWTAAATDSLLHQDEDQMKIDQMIESSFIKQSDVPDPVIVTITAIKKVNVARKEEDPEYRWTAQFKEFEKPMVLNVTNLKRAAKALGSDSDDWIGQRIELYTDPDIEFGGNIVGGLRLRGLRKAPLSKTRSTEDINRELDDSQPPF